MARSRTSTTWPVIVTTASSRGRHRPSRIEDRGSKIEKRQRIAHLGPYLLLDPRSSMKMCGVLPNPDFAGPARHLSFPGVPMRHLFRISVGLLLVAMLIGCGP